MQAPAQCGLKICQLIAFFADSSRNSVCSCTRMTFAGAKIDNHRWIFCERSHASGSSDGASRSCTPANSKSPLRAKPRTVWPQPLKRRHSGRSPESPYLSLIQHGLSLKSRPIEVSENAVLRDFDDSLVQTSFLGTVSLSGVMPVHENQRPISRCNDDADGASIACASGIFVLVG